MATLSGNSPSGTAEPQGDKPASAPAASDVEIPIRDPETVESLKLRNAQLEEKLKAAKFDAKETLLALLQMAEGVRVITKQMQSATHVNGEEETNTTGSIITPEESKKEELTEQFFSDSIVKETCLRGTIFGTDLLRLWDAAQHTRDFSRMVSEESKLSVEDIIQAQTTAKKALKRAKRAESAVRKLQQENKTLHVQLEKTTSERRVLLKEVKSLRQYVATSRKMEMEQLLQQHVAGALLLHEEQLKAMSAQQRKLRHEEEKKKDEEDLELVQAEDCQEEEGRERVERVEAPQADASGPEVEKNALKPKEECEASKTTHFQNKERNVDQGAELSKVNNSSESRILHKDAEDDVAGTNEVFVENLAPAASPKTSNEHPTEAKVEKHQVNKDSVASVGFGGNSSGGILGFGSWASYSMSKEKPQGAVTITDNITQQQETAINGNGEPPQHRESNDKENSQQASCANQNAPPSTSTTKADKPAPSISYSPVKLFPSFVRAPSAPVQKQLQQQQQPQPQQQKPDSSRSIGSSSSNESQKGPGVGTKMINFLFHPEKIHHNHQQAPLKPAAPVAPKRSNALLKLSDSEEDMDKEKDSASLDETAPMTMATSSSSCAASREETLSSGDQSTGNSADDNVDKYKPASSPRRVIPGSVSWSEDNQSIQSNLPSPQFQHIPRDMYATSTNSSQGEKSVELYKDLKVFKSLAIPNDDEIDDYHYYQHQYQQEPPPVDNRCS